MCKHYLAPCPEQEQVNGGQSARNVDPLLMLMEIAITD